MPELKWVWTGHQDFLSDTTNVASDSMSVNPGEFHNAANSGWTITPADLHDAFRHGDVVYGTPVGLGRVSVTRPVDTQLMRDITGQTFVHLCLIRHERGDWGDLDAHDTAANAAAMRHGGRLLSTYPIPRHVAPDAIKDDTLLWIITEAADDAGNRLATTVLYPSN